METRKRRWVIEEYSPGRYVVNDEDRPEKDENGYPGNIVFDGIDSREVAALGAAAPELLEALKMCLYVLDIEQVARAAHGLGLVPARQAARSAIAKAEGRS